MRAKKRHRRVIRWHTILFFCLLPALLAACDRGDLQFPTEYQAVFLDNGQVFFGRLRDDGSSYLTLRDVFYIKRQAIPDKKEVQSLLVKRGSEWHAPDFMRINSRHVVLIEPVAPDSQVALLIREVQAHPVAAAPAPPSAAAPALPATPAPALAAPGTPVNNKLPAAQR
ncbi:MAG: hypothetical protein ACLPT6_01595 [Desulfobaccales bacterium]|jgi:hypothetical protein